MANLNDDERLNLKKLVTEMEGEDNTHNIRRIKHSVPMRDDIRIIDTLKNTHADMRQRSPEEFNALCQSKCSFLYNNYTDIYNKIISDELDMTIMTKYQELMQKGSIWTAKMSEMSSDFGAEQLTRMLEIQSKLASAAL